MKNNRFLRILINNIYEFFTKNKSSVKMISDKQASHDDEEKVIDKDTFRIKEEQNVEKQKADFFELYNEAKEDNFDVYKLNRETLAKICDMMEEEIKIKKRILEEKRIELKKISS